MVRKRVGVIADDITGSNDIGVMFAKNGFRVNVISLEDKPEPTDFDGIDAPPKGLESAEKLYKLFDELARLGYSDELIEKISHKNFARVFSECLK